MNEFVDGFIQTWAEIIDKVHKGFPNWTEIGSAFAIITVGLLIIFVFAFFFLYLPFRWEERDRMKRRMDPENPYYGRDTLESR